MKWKNRNERKLDPQGRVKNEPKRLKALILARTNLPSKEFVLKVGVINGVLPWCRTPEGFHFWNDISHGIYPKGYNRILDKFEKNIKRGKPRLRFKSYPVIISSYDNLEANILLERYIENDDVLHERFYQVAVKDLGMWPDKQLIGKHDE